jgi:hypothetical protein
MDIEEMFNKLSENEKDFLFLLLKKEREKKSFETISVKDFLINFSEINPRIKNAFINTVKEIRLVNGHYFFVVLYRPDKYTVKEVEKELNYENLIKFRNVGKQSVVSFLKLIDKNR